MQIFVILTAVLLTIQAATVPPVVTTHKVSVPLPGNVLSSSIDSGEIEIPAVVVEVTKDHKHNPDAPLKLVEQKPVLEEAVVSEATSELPQGQETSTVQPNPDVPIRLVEQKPVVEEAIVVLRDVVSDETSELPQGQETSTGKPDSHITSESTVVATTLLPLIDDVVSTILANVETTTAADAEELTTDITTDQTETTLQPLLSEFTTEVVHVVNNNDSSEEDNSSSIERFEDDILHPHPHNNDEGTVPHVHNSPPISEDVSKIKGESDSSASSDSNSSSSQEGNNSTPLVKVPLESDKVVVRRRRHHRPGHMAIDEKAVKDDSSASVSSAQSSEEGESLSKDSLEAIKPLSRHRRALPFNQNQNLATATPKLLTDPKKIAEILAKSKNVQIRQRAMRSVSEDSFKLMTPSSTLKPVDDMSATIDPCDLLCTKFEIDPVCATNGRCLHEFPNQCILETYNCRHPMKKFSATKDDRCQMHWLDFCEESDLV